MCGIVGLVAFDASPEACTSLVERMAEHIRHRGPDGGGVESHPDATIGMTRLAIVDVVHGQQPMLNDDGSVALVFNGEIYNAPALRSELERDGVRFRTRSDTEVILRLYERAPNRVEELLVGMWAFAIHDRRRRRFVLSRDRMGIKPLFVADTGTSLAFASELRAFDRDLRGFSKLFTLDHEAAHAMLSWSYVPDDSTIWKGIERLPPATRLEIDLATGRRSRRVYWELVPSADAARIQTLDEACREVDALLSRAVREHLESDVPIATLLSGGIDSSLVTSYAMRESSRPIQAFSIGFEEKRFDESPYARATAERLGVPIDVAIFDEETARGSVVDALLAYDEPFGDSSSLATYLVSKQIARGFKVALGGDGGDEVFAGYRKYLMVRLRKLFSRAPGVRDRLGKMLEHLPNRNDRSSFWTETSRQLRRLSRGLSGTDAQAYAQLTQFAPLAVTSALVRTPVAPSRFFAKAMQRFGDASGTELQRTLAGDLGNTLVNDMLVKVDRASMANQLEVRVPFLDHRLVEFGVGLRAPFTIGGGGKRVLRALHERRFGPELARRKKQGFGVPVEKWLRGPFDGACERLFESRRLDRYGVLSSEALGDGRFRAWATSNPMILWHAFALAAWCEATLGDGPDALRELVAPATRAPIAGGELSLRAPD